MKNRQRMNVQDIAEVLVAEIEDFKKVAMKLEETGRLNREVSQAMGHRLQEMKDTRLKVDTTDLREFIKDFKRLKESKTQVPQWIVILLVVSIFGAFFGWGFAFKEYRQKHEVIRQYEVLYQEYERVKESVQ